MLFVKKAMPLEASQWNKHGDHTAVQRLPEALVEKYSDACGWIPLQEGGMIVGPTDCILS